MQQVTVQVNMGVHHATIEMTVGLQLTPTLAPQLATSCTVVRRRCCHLALAEYIIKNML